MKPIWLGTAIRVEYRWNYISTTKTWYVKISPKGDDGKHDEMDDKPEKPAVQYMKK